MQFRLPCIFATLLTASVISSVGLHPATANAQTRRFICAKVDGGFATIAKTPQGDRTVIRWAANDFSGSGWTPIRRCREVSAKFQEYHTNGTLKYLTTGRIRGQNVICTAARKGGNCTALLMTIRPGRNPTQTLRDLMSVRVHASGPLNETENRLYIDMEEYLRAEVPTPQTVRPVAQPTPPMTPPTSTIAPDATPEQPTPAPQNRDFLW